MVEGELASLATHGVLQAAALRVDCFDACAQLELDTERGVDLRQLLGDPPDAIAHEAVVAVEHRTGIHHWQRECGVGVVQRDRSALGDGHRHVNLGALCGQVMIEQVRGAAGDPQARERIAEPLARFLESRRRGVAVALLQVGDDARFIAPEAGDIAALAPFLAQLAVERQRIAVDPGAGPGIRKIDALGSGGHEALQTLGEAGLPEDEFRHQPEHRGAERITLAAAVYGRGLEDAGAAGPVGSLEHRDPAAGTAQVVCRDQSVDAGPDHHHVWAGSLNRHGMLR